MRLFVALVPPATVTDHLDEFLAPRRAAADFRWTASDQVHVTLAFLGSVADRHLEPLVESLEEAAARRTTFEARVQGGGAFPDPAQARVLWAGLGLSDAARTILDRLSLSTRAAAGRSGIQVDGQRFRPHLTLARLSHPAEVSSWVRLLDTYAGPTWTADHIAVIESHLGEGPRGRPRHEVVAELPLTSPAGRTARP